MLDLGFLPDVEKIVAQLPTKRQTMLFSATMPSAVLTLSRRYMRQATTVRAEEPEENRTVPTTAQHIFRAHPLDKPEMLARILQAKGRGLTIIFTRTKRAADKLSLDLTERGFAAAAVHGDLGQGQREQALRAFRAGKVDVLVATDVAARGIDVKGVTHVVNYTCPEDEKTYLHRIGRTGRAGENGVAITFVDWDDLTRWNGINQVLQLPFPDPPETYSTSRLAVRGARHPAYGDRHAAPRRPAPGRPRRRDARGPRRDRTLAQGAAARQGGRRRSRSGVPVPLAATAPAERREGRARAAHSPRSVRAPVPEVAALPATLPARDRHHRRRDHRVGRLSVGATRRQPASPPRRPWRRRPGAAARRRRQHPRAAS